MFIHRAKIQIKPDSFIELSRKISGEIMPMLRLQKGFCSGVTSIDTQWLTATEDTLWETKEDAEAYHLTAFLEIKKMISKVATGEPLTSIFDNSEYALVK